MVNADVIGLIKKELKVHKKLYLYVFASMPLPRYNFIYFPRLNDTTQKSKSDFCSPKNKSGSGADIIFWPKNQSFL